MLDKLPRCRRRISLPVEGIDLHFLSALDHVSFIATANPSQNGHFDVENNDVWCIA